MINDKLGYETTQGTGSSKFQGKVIQVFAALDRNKSGSLDPDEVEAGMKALGIPVTKATVQNIFGKLDSNGDGSVTLQEFASYCDIRLKEIRRTFDAIDTDRNGTISSEEIKLCVQALGMKISSQQLRGMVSRVVKHESGSISFDEFVDALLLLPATNPEAVFEAWQSLPLDDAESGFSVARDARTALKQTMFGAILQQLYSGGIAGAISRTATAPIDRLKVMAQAAPPGVKSLGLIQGVRAIYAEGGVRAFFRGNGANVIKIAPETAVKFMAFDAVKRAIARDPGNVTVGERFLAGGAAGAIAQTAIYPLEILKTRMAVSPPGTYRGLWDCLAAVARREGPAALYKGLGASVAGIVPYAGVDLMVNSVFKEQVSARYVALGREPGVAVLLCGGVVSSSCAMLVTYPLNLVRTRLQASGMPGAVVYSGAADCLRRTLAADGVRGLYKGIGPNMLKVLPATGLSYAVFDVLSKRPAR